MTTTVVSGFSNMVTKSLSFQDNHSEEIPPNTKFTLLPPFCKANLASIQVLTDASRETLYRITRNYN
jgi:hypothetical protein